MHRANHAIIWKTITLCTYFKWYCLFSYGFFCKYCKKGTQVAVNGRISSRSYDAQDGTKRYVTEVVANNVTFVGGKNDSTPSSEESGTDYGMSSSSEVEPMDLAEDPYKDFGSEVTLSDDDLPF